MDELGNLKLPELKKECKARGLSITGNKAELIARLHSAMAAEKPASDDSVIEDALLDEDSMLGEDDSSGVDSSLEDSSNAVDLTSPTIIKASPEKKLEAVKRTASISPTKPIGQTNGAAVVLSGSPPAKKKITINRQPLPTPAAPAITSLDSAETKDGEKQVIKITATVSAEDKAKLRQEKFGAAKTSEPTTVAPVNKPAAASSISSNPFLDERLKKRAERFGPGAGTDSAATPAVTGKVSLTTEDDVKLAKRKERFGLGLTKPAEERKEQRAARFGAGVTSTTTITASSVITPITVAPAGDTDDKKKSRAARFGAAP